MILFVFFLLIVMMKMLLRSHFKFVVGIILIVLLTKLWMSQSTARPSWTTENNLPNIPTPRHEFKWDQWSYLESLELTHSGDDEQFIKQNCQYTLTNTVSIRAKICLFSDEKDQYVSKRMKAGIVWEERIQKLIFNNVFPKHTDAAFVDIGSNLGALSLVAAKLGRQTFAFDPTKETARYLSTSAYVNNLKNNLHVYPAAVMEKRYSCIGHQSNPDSPQNPGGNNVKFVDDCDEKASPVATLDDLLPIFRKLGLKKAILKADCEGSEPRVILGGQNFLREISVPFIQMEWNIVKKDLKKKGANYTDMVNKAVEVMFELNFVPIPLGGTLADSVGREHYTQWPYDMNWIKRDI